MSSYVASAKSSKASKASEEMNATPGPTILGGAGPENQAPLKNFPLSIILRCAGAEKAGAKMKKK
jgi:hypothetical protein